MILTLPNPPSVNGLYRNVPHKGRAKTGSYKAWIDEAGICIKTQCPVERISGPFEVDIVLGKVRGDIDNRIKAVVDCLVANKLVDDDRNLARVQISRGEADVDYCMVYVMATA